MAAAVDSDEPDDISPGADDPDDTTLDGVQGVVRGEVEAVAAEFDDVTNELPPEEVARLEDAARRPAQVREAFEAAPEARRQIAPRGR